MRRRPRGDGGRLVHQVRVLEDEQRGSRLYRAQEPDQRVVQLRPEELRVQIANLGRRLHLGFGGGGDQRQPGHPLGIERGGDLGEASDRDVGGILPAEPEELAQHPAPRDVGRGRGVRLAHGVHLTEIRRLAAQLLGQAGLPDARLADQLQRPAGAAADLLQRAGELGELLPPPEQWEPATSLAEVAYADARAHGERPDRVALALHQERLQLGHVEHRRRVVKNLRGGVELALGGFRHQPGGEVHGVSLDRVRLAERRTEVRGEHVPGVRPRLHGERERRLQDRPERREHPVLVLPGALRRADDQHDPPPVARDVGLEESDAVAERGGLHRPHAGVDRGGDGIRTLGSQQVIGAGELDEGGGDATVLGLRFPGQQVLAHRSGDEGTEVHARNIRPWLRRVGRCIGLSTQQEPVALGLPRPPQDRSRPR